MPRNPAPRVDARLGAPMGRASPGAPHSPAPVKASLRRIRLNLGGYDSGGAYWGLGQPLYWAGSDCGAVDMFFRAPDRAAAKATVLERHPGARFYR